MPKQTASRPRTRRRARRVGHYRSDPVHFVNRILGQELWSKQREVLHSVRDNQRTAVAACHGPGKTFVAACAVLWFLRLPEARVVTTAPTWTQVKKLLWHEVGKLYHGSRADLGGTILQTELTMRDGRYAIGLSTKPEQRESFQGHHAPNLLLIYDEASGIPQDVFDAGEGYMTTAGAKMLLIGNPTRPSGEFFDAFHSDRSSYSRISISAFDLPWATGEKISDRLAAHLTGEAWVEDRRKKWGEGSPLWQVKVLGQFPAQAENAVMSMSAIEAAQAQEHDQVPDADRVISCDVARFGNDETTIYVREGTKVRLRHAYTGQPTTATVGHIKRLRRELLTQREGHVRIVVDDDGVGGGVTDQLREADLDVTPFRGGAAPLDPDEYPNARSELWFTVAGQIADLDIDPDDQLAADLLAPTYKLDSKGRRVVEPKEQTKKRLGRSPDRGDGVLLALAPNRSSAGEVW
jgi:phage terminase large subunit